jgi:hypothetical protein
MPAGRDGRSSVASPGYRWYTGSQAVSIVGTMMSYTALYWLTLHIARGNAVVLSTLVAAQFLPMLVFSRRAGTIVARHRAVRVVIVTQAAQAIGALALGIPLLAGWMTIWYLWVLSFAIGCVQAVDVPARQMFMLDLVGEADLRRGSSLYAAITGLSKIAGPGLAGIIIAVSGEAAVFLADAASFVLVIGVLGWLSRGVLDAAAPARSDEGGARRFSWLLDLPRGIQVAAGMALLIGGFGIQFEVTNPLRGPWLFRIPHLGGPVRPGRDRGRGDARGVGLRRAHDRHRRGGPAVRRQRDGLRAEERASIPAGPRAHRLQRRVHGLRPRRVLRCRWPGSVCRNPLGTDRPRRGHRDLRGRRPGRQPEPVRAAEQGRMGGWAVNFELAGRGQSQ